MFIKIITFNILSIILIIIRLLIIKNINFFITFNIIIKNKRSFIIIIRFFMFIKNKFTNIFIYIRRGRFIWMIIRINFFIKNIKKFFIRISIFFLSIAIFFFPYLLCLFQHHTQIIFQKNVFCFGIGLSHV